MLTKFSSRARQGWQPGKGGRAQAANAGHLRPFDTILRSRVFPAENLGSGPEPKLQTRFLGQETRLRRIVSKRRRDPAWPASDDDEEIGFGYFGGDDSIFSDGGDPMVVAAGLA